MSELFHKYWQLTLLNVTPQELPGHSLALWISMAAAFVTGTAGLLFAYSVTEAVIRSVLAIAVPGLLIYAMLGVKNLQARFQQAFSALCGSAAIIYLIALPLLPAFFSAAVGSPSGNLVVIMVLLLDFWTVLITAHILRHTFDIGFASGLSLSVVMVFVTLLTIEAVAPMKRIEKTPDDSLTGASLSLTSGSTPLAMMSGPDFTASLD